MDDSINEIAGAKALNTGAVPEIEKMPETGEAGTGKAGAVPGTEAAGNDKGTPEGLDITHIKIPKFANLLYDDWFKRAFGTEKRKRLLLLLLREIIPERNIKSIEYQPTEHINHFAEKADIRIDVECTSEDGTRFIVEVQRARQLHFGNRMLYYSTFAIQQQLRKGHEDFNYPPAYIIAFMNFELHKDAGEYMYRYMLTETTHQGDVLTDRLQIILLELPKVSREQAKKGTRLELFCYYLCHLTMLDDIPEKSDDELFRMLYNSAETDNFTPEERTKLIDDMTTEQDIRNQIEYGRYEGRMEGLKEGMEQGREEGELKAKLELAKAMTSEGLPEEMICRLTGFTEEQIKGLSDTTIAWGNSILL